MKAICGLRTSRSDSYENVLLVLLSGSALCSSVDRSTLVHHDHRSLALLNLASLNTWVITRSKNEQYMEFMLCVLNRSRPTLYMGSNASRSSSMFSSLMSWSKVINNSRFHPSTLVSRPYVVSMLVCDSPILVSTCGMRPYRVMSSGVSLRSLCCESPPAT